MVPEHLRALVLLATFAGPRWGEVVALRWMDLGLNAGTVAVRQAQVELDTGELIIGPPKSRADLRTVALPQAIISGLRRHLGNFIGAEDGALIFTGKRGGVLQRANFRRATSGPRPWPSSHAEPVLSRPPTHREHLRGRVRRDLMERMGHDSVRAAMTYQHRTADGNRAITQAMDNKINNANPDDEAAGTLALVG